MNQYEIKYLGRIIAEQQQNLSPRTDIRGEQILSLKEIEKELYRKTKYKIIKIKYHTRYSKNCEDNQVMCLLRLDKEDNEENVEKNYY